MRTKATHNNCRQSEGAVPLGSAGDADPNRFRGTHDAAAKVHPKWFGSTPFMSGATRARASHAAKVLFFQSKIDDGKIQQDSIPGLLRDYPELRVSEKKEAA